MSDDNRLNSLHHEINRRFDDLDNKLSKQDKDKEEILSLIHISEPTRPY